jgi:hypothetical protein
MARELHEAHPHGRDRVSLYLGIGLVVLGAAFLVLRLVDVDVSSVPWPFWVIGVGLVLIIAGFVSRSLSGVLLVPGCMLTTIGLILLIQSSMHLWTTWLYAWALVAPGAFGLGLALQGLVVRRSWMVRVGLGNLVAGLIIFLILAGVFEIGFHLNDQRFSPVGRIVIPAALIVLGLAMVASNQLARRHSV